MRRSVEYFRWRSREWEHHSTSTANEDSYIRAGLRAYGLQQATMFSKMARVFAESWREVRVKARWVVENEDFLEDEEPQGCAGADVEEDVDDALNVEDADDLAWRVDTWDVAGAEDI